MNTSALAALLLLVLVASVAAEDPAPPLPPAPLYTIECQMVVLPLKTFLPLLPELSDDRKILGAWPRVLEMVGRGEATLSAALVCHIPLGANASTESLEEVRYATEYDPPPLPDAAQLATLTPEVLKNWPYVGIPPTAFETRNVGASANYELQATADPKICRLNCSVQHVRLERMNKIDAGRINNGERLSLEQPQFSVQRDTCILSLPNGVPKLLGVHRLPGPEAIFEVFVVSLRFPSP